MSIARNKPEKVPNVESVWVEYQSSVGSTYYIHSVTKEKIYEKPLELASPEERIQILEKRRKQKIFFNEMEENVHRRLTSASSEGTQTTIDVTNESDSKSSYDRMDGSSSAYGNTLSSISVPAQEKVQSLENFFDFNEKERATSSGISGAVGAGAGLRRNRSQTRTISSLDLTAISQADDAKVYAEVESLLESMAAFPCMPT